MRSTTRVSHIGLLSLTINSLKSIGRKTIIKTLTLGGPKMDNPPLLSLSFMYATRRTAVDDFEAHEINEEERKKTNLPC